MNKPINNSTLPSLPDYHNQPLKLTTQEIESPDTVIEDFFQTYHLPDIRNCLDNWLHDGLVVETIESKSHFYTHDKIIKLVEACWIIRQNNKSINSQSNTSIPDPIEPMEVLGKPAQLIEMVESNPMFVVTEVFKSKSLPYFRDQIRDWLHVAISADCSIYEEGEQRVQLLTFQGHLQILIEALYIIYNQNKQNLNIAEQISEENKPRLLRQDQIAKPKQVITEFFDIYPMIYITRELNDWLEAGIAYAGDYPDNMHELQALYTYRNVLCLMKAANRLLNLQETHPPF